MFGLLCFFGGVSGVVIFGPSETKTVVKKIAQKSGLLHMVQKDTSFIGTRYVDYQFRGEIKNFRPRVLLNGQSDLDLLRKRYSGDPDYKRLVDKIGKTDKTLWKSVSWAIGGNQKNGEYVVTRLPKIKLTPPYEGGFGNSEIIAFTYDLAWGHSSWTPEKRQLVGIKIRKALEKTLSLLDSMSPSLWHGRFQLTCTGWILAASLDNPDSDKNKRLVAQAQAFFLDALKAIELTGGWPEGYNYWINNRAFNFIAAASAHIHLVDEPEINGRLKKTVSRVGLWTVYGTEPSGKFVLFGDAGPRNDLKDETQRVIDLAGMITGDPVFKVYSRYLYGLHGTDGYYYSYRWGIPIFRGKAGQDFTANEQLADLSIFNSTLNKSELFGRQNFGQTIIRSDWGPDATFISFRSGNTFTHHGHYQAGHFTITKRAPLAITSGTYGSYTSPHRLDYYIRTVASNSILVLKPEEKVKPNQFFTENVSGGGQRIVMPTGSEVQSVEDWQSNLNKGRHYEGGKILAFDNSHDNFVYISSDLTGAYNNTKYDENGEGGKVSSITRSLVYLYNEDLLIDYDQVNATNGSYTKKWLLHSWAKPQSPNETILVGDEYNGILETKDATVGFEHNGGTLQVTKLFPEDGVIRKIGGPDYRYYVEVDGDDSDLDGKNMSEGGKRQAVV